MNLTLPSLFIVPKISKKYKPFLKLFQTDDKHKALMYFKEMLIHVNKY